MNSFFTFFFAILFIASSAFSQTTVLQNDFNSYDGTTATVAPGWYYSWNTAASTSGGPSYYSSAAYSGVAPNAYKWGGVNGQKDTIITPAFAPANSVSFWCRGAGVPYKQQDTLEIYESPDSISWTLAAMKDSLPTAGTTLTYTLQPASQFLKFVYHKAAVNGGSVAFDDIVITSNATGIAGMPPAQDIKVFPSVSSGVFFIHANMAVQCELYNCMGEKLNAPSVSRNNFQLDLGAYPDGIYLLKLISAVGTVTKKIMIVR